MDFLPGFIISSDCSPTRAMDSGFEDLDEEQDQPPEQRQLYAVQPGFEFGEREAEWIVEHWPKAEVY
ncbi:MAG: hypothetical protein JOS17DRAFT_793229 [Linnemannia elongata]|nr:MAG: hypothetical protein JOS17DRAFT_793229 [Linnemannia elongata]